MSGGRRRRLQRILGWGAIVFTSMSGTMLLSKQPYLAAVQFVMCGWGMNAVISDHYNWRCRLCFLQVCRVTKAYQRWFERIRRAQAQTIQREPWEQDPDWWRRK